MSLNVTDNSWKGFVFADFYAKFKDAKVHNTCKYNMQEIQSDLLGIFCWLKRISIKILFL